MKVKLNKKPLPRPFNDIDARKFHGFRGKPKDKIFLGVELEYEIPRTYKKTDDVYTVDIAYWEKHPRVVEQVDKICKDVGRFAVISEDSSLTNGVEIITAPTSYQKQRKAFSGFFAKTLPEHKMRVTRKCGMHVHVSKDKLREEQLDNLINFMSAPENKSFLEAVAGRGQNMYCQYKDPRKRKPGDYGKFWALNTYSEATVEFRIFKAPTTQEEYLVRLQLVRALVSYSGKSFKNSVQGFKAFLNRSRSFKELRAFITANNL